LSVLQELNNTDGVNILAPFGTLLVDTPLADDDIDESIDSPPPAETTDPPVPNIDLVNNANMRVEVEDALGELDSVDINLVVGQMSSQRIIESKVLISGTLISKAWALSGYSKSRIHAGSTDHLRRVQDIPRFESSKKIEEMTSISDGSDVLIVSDPIATLLHCEKKFWLCIGEVNALRIDG